jgi:hypothetical protein
MKHWAIGIIYASLKDSLGDAPNFMTMDVKPRGMVHGLEVTIKKLGPGVKTPAHELHDLREENKSHRKMLEHIMSMMDDGMAQDAALMTQLRSYLADDKPAAMRAESMDEIADKANYSLLQAKDEQIGILRDELENVKAAIERIIVEWFRLPGHYDSMQNAMREAAERAGVNYVERQKS